MERVIYSLQIVLDSIETDPNRLNGVDWRDKYNRFEKIKRDIHYLSHNQKPETPLTKFKISVLRIGPKTFDWDNLVASLKPVIDGLTLAGIIFDDSWKYIKSIEIDQKISKTEKKLILNITGESDGSIPKAKRTRRVAKKRMRPVRKNVVKK